MIRTWLIVLFITVFLSVPYSFAGITTQIDHSDSLPAGVILSELLPFGYSGKEKLKYNVSWTGGIKVGELHLEVNAIPGEVDGFEIRANVTTKHGAVHYIYPIDDLHVTKIRGANKLPYHYEVWQKEGYSYRAHRVYEYDQDNGSIHYFRDGEFKEQYQVVGGINNEFSSFFNSRLMEFELGSKFIVPTFADKKKADVVVHVVSKTQFKNSVIGAVLTSEIMPIMDFKGLYEKKGDTVIWYSDDECRVPIRIISKIAIGSLTADLFFYENPNCKRYSAFMTEL